MTQEIRFAWVCRNIYFDTVERVELTDTMLLDRSYLSWITTDNCEIIAKILPIGRKDKSGKGIYQGDIVRFDVTEGSCGTLPDPLINMIGEIRWDDEDTGFFILSNNGAWPHIKIHFASRIEIIGNIYENPSF